MTGCSWPSRTPVKRSDAMRSMWTRTSALGLLLLAVAVVAAQKPGPTDEPGTEKKKETTKLEQALILALKNNADIRVGDAKCHEAEAELSRTRLAVTQKVVTLLTQIEAQERVVDEAKARVERLRAAKQAVGVEELQAGELALQKAKADLAV